MGFVEIKFNGKKIKIEDISLEETDGRVILDDDVDKTEEIPVIKEKKLEDTLTDVFGDDNG